jgi:L-threonylcarbamoyladenylate synthase
MTTTERLGPGEVHRAAAILKAGGLVAFPTETVYGLGALALDPGAVERIYQAKGRPAGNPLIVHLAGVEGAAEVVSDWPEVAQKLAERFWPGPMTLVLPRSPRVPDRVTAGGPTVAVRVPNHPVALELLRAVGAPLAAPSANRSGEVSPTRAEHVPEGLADAVLDGGPCPGGIESTVLSLTGPPRLLRPGLISPARIEAVIGPIARGPLPQGPLPSPGLLERHYAPRARLVVTQRALERCQAEVGQGRKVALITHLGGPGQIPFPMESLPPDPEGYASALYDALHRLDRLGVELIITEALPDSDEWLALRDRLRRASA